MPNENPHNLEVISGPEADARARVQANAFREAVTLVKTLRRGGWTEEHVQNLIDQHRATRMEEYEKFRDGDTFVQFSEIGTQCAVTEDEKALSRLLAENAEVHRGLLKKHYDLACAAAQARKEEPPTVEQFILAEGSRANTGFFSTESRIPENKNRRTAMKTLVYTEMHTLRGELGPDEPPKFLKASPETFEAILKKIGALPEQGNLGTLDSLKIGGAIGVTVEAGESYRIQSNQTEFAMRMPTKWEGVTADIDRTNQMLYLVFESDQVDKLLKMPGA